MKRKKSYVGLVIASVAFSFAFVSAVTLAMSDDGREAVMRSLAGYVDTHADGNVAGLLGQFLVASTNEPSIGSVSVTRANESSNFNEVGLISADVTQPKTLVRGFAFGTMPSSGTATTTQFFQNSTGGPIWIDLDATFAQFQGTASSSVELSMGTSTKSGIAAYTTALTAPVIQSFKLATSTIGSQEAGLVVATGTRKLVYLANNEYVLWAWKQPDSNGCSGSFCEAVTSSARGYSASTTVSYLRLVDY